MLIVLNGNVPIKFFKQTVPEKYVWPEVDDIDIISRSNIIDILKEPQMDRRDTLSFK